MSNGAGNNPHYVIETMSLLMRYPVPDKASEEKRSIADESGSVRFFPLRTRQCQPIVHMTLTVQNGLLTNHLQTFPIYSFVMLNRNSVSFSSIQHSYKIVCM